MLFPADAGTAGMDATGAKLLQRCLGMIKQKPVVAAYGDVPVALTTTLFQLSPFMAAFGGPLVCCIFTSPGLLRSPRWFPCSFIVQWHTRCWPACVRSVELLLLIIVLSVVLTGPPT